MEKFLLFALDMLNKSVKSIFAILPQLQPEKRISYNPKKE